MSGTVGGYYTVFYSTDELMGTYRGMLGIKTGAVTAGTAFLGAARRDSVTLYTAVIGCSTSYGRFADTESLLNWAFDAYNVITPVSERWVVNVMPYAYDFRYQCLVSPHTEGRFELWSGAGSLNYRTTRITRDILMTPDFATGVTRWSQADRHIADTAYTTIPELVRVPAVGIFELPLFYPIDARMLVS